MCLAQMATLPHPPLPRPAARRRLAALTDAGSSAPLPPADADRPLLATAIPGGPIIIPEEEPAVAMQLAGAEASPQPSAGAKPSASPENPFALPEEPQQAGALTAPSPTPQATKPLNASDGGGAGGAPSPLPSPPWVEPQEAAQEWEDLPTDEELERADALGVANDCREFGWTVLRFEHNPTLPLQPQELAGAQVEARKLAAKRR